MTVWEAGKKGWKAEKFKWRRSRIGVTWSLDDQFLITSMQENALHGWRLQDRMDMQMSGYPRKVRSWAWSYTGHYLITTGTNRAVCWPFRDKDGPMGKTPMEVGEEGRQPATAVASHPLYPYMAIGFQDGLTLLTALEADSSCLPLRSSGHNAVAVLVFALDGRRLLVGDEAGEVRWFNLPEI